MNILFGLMMLVSLGTLGFLFWSNLSTAEYAFNENAKSSVSFTEREAGFDAGLPFT